MLIPPSPPDVLNPAVTGIHELLFLARLKSREAREAFRRYGAGTHRGKIVIAIE
jgi:hypothetical protein